MGVSPTQLTTWAALSNCAALALLLDLAVRRVRQVADGADAAKHKEEVRFDHDAPPLPASPAWLAVVARGSAAMLAGATLPWASAMLASNTPAHGTLGVAWVLSAFSLGGALAAAADAVQRAGPEKAPKLALAPVCAATIVDIVIASLAVAAAARPLDLMQFSSVSEVRGGDPQTPRVSCVGETRVAALAQLRPKPPVLAALNFWFCELFQKFR